MSAPLDYVAIRSDATAAIRQTGREVTFSDGTSTVMAFATIVPTGGSEGQQRVSDFGDAVDLNRQLAVIDAQPFIDGSHTLSRAWEITDTDGTVWRISSLDPIKPATELVVYQAILEA